MRRPITALAVTPVLAAACVVVACAAGARVVAPAPVAIAAEPAPSTPPHEGAAEPPRDACGARAPDLAKGDVLGGVELASGQRDLMGPYFSAGFGFHPLAGAPPAPRTGADGPFQVEIAAPATRKPNEALGIELAFVSTSDRPVVVARPLDGSLERWRSPTYDLYARDERDGRTYRFAFTGGRCGNVNAITKDDFVTLAPKQRRTDVVNGWASHLAQAGLPKAGQYTVWVVYSYCGYEEGGVPLGEDVKRDDVSVGVHASNAIAVTVR